MFPDEPKRFLMSSDLPPQPPPSVRGRSGLGGDLPLSEQVRAAWLSAEQGDVPDLGPILAAAPGASDAEIADACIEDAEHRAERGLSFSLEHYLASIPEHADKAEVARALLMLECSARASEGVERVGADLRARFPALVEEVDAVIEMIALMRSGSGSDGQGSGFEIAEGALLDDYRLEEFLGAGSFGEVWRAWDRTLERYVALKLITPRASLRPVSLGPEGSDGTLAAVIREAKSAASIDHENVVRVHDAGRFTSASLCYIDTQLAGDPAPRAGDAKHVAVARSLAALVSERGRGGVPARDGASLMSAVARGVAAAHARGIVHRDIKPSNILVTPSGRPMVADFGLSALSARSDAGSAPAGSGSSIAATLSSGRITGTPAFMAPEQARGEAATPASDVFSLGATMRFVLTGKLPFAPSGRYSTDERWDVIEQVRRFDCRPLAEERPDLPADLSAICDRAMSPDPKDRYPAAAAFAEDLAAFLANRPVSARPAGALRASVMWAARNRTIVSLIALMGVLGAAGLWRYIVNIGHERDRAVAAEAATASQLRKTEKAQQATQAVNDFLQSVLGAADPQLLGREATILEAVRFAEGGIAHRFLGDPELEAGVRQTIGSVYSTLGLADGARVHLERALDLRRATLGERAPETFAARHELAKMEEQRAHDKKAGEAVEALVIEMRAALGPEHPETLRAEITLLSVMATAHRLAEALALSERAVEAWRRAGKEDSSEAMAAEQTRAALLCYNDRQEEGFAAFYALIEKQERLLGPTHYQRCIAMTDMAFTLKFFARYEEAAWVYRHALGGLMEHLPYGHEQQLVLACGLANLLVTHLGRPHEGLAVLEPVFEAYLARPDHPPFHVAKGWDILGVCLIGVGRYPEAELALLKARTAYLEMIGDGGNKVVRAIDRYLAKTYDALGLPEKACEHRELAQKRENPKGPPGP
ncbi:MAG: protein kinase domain-containing protein [Phycisphaerales bacterium]